MKINQLPAKTWNWLGMNEAEVDIGFDPSRNFKETSVTVPDGEKKTVIREIRDDEVRDMKNGPELILKTNCRVGKGSELTLIQVQIAKKEPLLYNGIETSVEENGTFRLIQLILGGGRNYYETRVELKGKGSSFEADLAYLLDGERKLDMNYVADHTGTQSQSRISAGGVLKGRSEKLFRGTIDFHRGCAGASGSEIEDVLLLDDTVRNQTIPLILCDEEDVEGSHGATIGKPSSELIFYMRSRGIPEEEIFRMIARAKLDAVANLIPEEETRERISEYLNGVV
ncbi:MAG: SufD family Fe-S cluster assembly protein [Lachnospiraceae bacterium]|nr:SufD family Fe-S cluster assembly protein [Lachnospiraceae bacterium]